MNRLIINKKVTLGLIIFLISTSCGYASWGGKFHSVQDSGKKVVNLGPCYVGDQVFTGFVMSNTGTETVRVIDVAPSVVFFNSPTALTQFEYLRFINYSPMLPIMLNPAVKASDTLVVQYFADSDTAMASLGRKEALFQIGFVKPSDTTEIVAIDTFKLIAKKTRKFVDGYDDIISFDSVYINPAYPFEYQWRVKNTQTKSYDIVRQRDTLYSKKLMGDEFSIENKTLPLKLTNKSYFVPWKISYSPKDEGTDTAGIFLYFKPYPSKYPDSLDICKTKVIATGVRQNLVIESADFNFSSDTLFLGDLPVSEAKRFRLSLMNTGNLPFGAYSQSFKNSSDGEATGFIFKKQFLNDKSNLRKNFIDSCVFDVTINERGPQVFKYIIDSDISRRSIRGYQYSDTYKSFVIVCRGVAPSIDIKTDLIDFGNVVYSGAIGEDCPSKKDTVIKISNRGNTDLIIKEFVLNANSYFSVKPLDMIIKAGRDSSFTITFNSDYPAKEHNDTLTLVTNCFAPYNTIKIPLTAWSVPPVIGDLSINKNMRSKPGSIINIPILIKNDIYKPAIYANSFETKLTFNPTILQYDNRSTINTAAEGAYIELDNSERGSINLKITGQDYFYPRDTLINLKFKVFMGDNISTELAFVYAKFSNGNCTGVIDVRSDNGSLILDSICGLEYKAIPYTDGRIVITGITPNPSNELVRLGVNLPFKVLTEIAIYDSYGNRVKELANGVLPSGAYEFMAQVSDLPVGVYVCRVSAGLHTENQTFVITR